MIHQTFGYYAHGVGADTAILPEGWQERVVAVRNENTRGYTGERLEVHDLAVSKLAAGRERDSGFVRVLLANGMVSANLLKERIEQVQTGGEPLRELMRGRLRLILTRSSPTMDP